MFDFHILLSILAVFLAWKWGDWRNWKVYYPTILFFIIGDLTYVLVTTNKTLWQYESRLLNGDFVELLIAVIIFPCTAFLFFALYRKVDKISKHKLIVYIAFFLFCAFVYTSVECLSCALGFFSYHNGWSIYLSFGFNCIMFPLLLLHYKNPLWAWLTSIFLAYLMIYFFKLPFLILKK